MMPYQWDGVIGCEGSRDKNSDIVSSKAAPNQRTATPRPLVSFLTHGGIESGILPVVEAERLYNSCLKKHREASTGDWLHTPGLYTPPGGSMTRKVITSRSNMQEDLSILQVYFY